MDLTSPVQMALTSSRFNVDSGSAISCTHEVSAFTLLLWDTALTFEREYKWIWRRPCPRFTKWFYLLSRYFPLLVQLANVVFVWSYMSKASLPIPTGVCRDYFSFQLVTWRLTLFLFDISLVMKVYATFNNDPRVGRWLFWAMVASVIVSMLCGPRIRKALEFDSACVPYSTPMIPFMVIIVSSMLRYAVKGYFIFKKSSLFGNPRSTRSSWARPFGDRVSFAALIGAFGVIAAIYPYGNTPSFRLTNQAVFLWPLTLCSILSTRLLLSMRVRSRASIDNIESEESS